VSRTPRALVGTLGWTGHTHPSLALARELDARGIDVTVEVTRRWADVVEGLGLRFAPAEDEIVYDGLPVEGMRGPTLPEAVRSRLPLLRELRPDVVVHDVLTLAPALAAEAAGVRLATLVPTMYPPHAPGLPFYPWGLRMPRTPIGKGAWRAIAPFQPLIDRRLRRERRQLNAVRGELGLSSLRRYHGPIGEGLALVATFPQLEYPRRWPAHVRVTGPMLFEEEDRDTELPEGPAPLVVVHSSTAQDPELKLARTALEALADEPVRMVATMSRPGKAWDGSVPDNAVVTDWVSYRQVLPQASLVIGSGGHGAVMKVLANGVPLVICPPGANMAELGARVAWAGAGLMLPKRLLTASSLRWAVRRVLTDPGFGLRAREIASWARDNDGAARGAELVQRYADGRL
jgi:UDP:flavonoid glycosyltransferase YjiC (YdhE family)